MSARSDIWPAPRAAPRLAERWIGWRNRLLASPAFQRWASGFPLARPIARRRADALFDLCAGFVYSQVLLAAVRLRLCNVLMDGPQTVPALAARLSLPVASARQLLEAATSLRLAQRVGEDRFAAGVLGAALVGNPGVAAMIEHHALLYADLQDPLVVLRERDVRTRLGALWPYAGDAAPSGLSADVVAPYSDLMAASQPFIAGDLLAAYRFDRHRHLMDIGGGDGTFLRQVARTAPRLRLTLFDLPAVADRARAQFAAAGMADRATCIGGDFRSDALPEGADLITLVRVAHDHDDTTVAAILAAAHRALPPGGKLLIAEPMAEERPGSGVGAYFAFYLMAMGSGRLRRPAELMAMLATAGFGGTRMLKTRQPTLVRALLACKS